MTRPPGWVESPAAVSGPGAQGVKTKTPPGLRDLGGARTFGVRVPNRAPFGGPNSSGTRADEFAWLGRSMPEPCESSTPRPDVAARHAAVHRLGDRGARALALGRAALHEALERN